MPPFSTKLTADLTLPQANSYADKMEQLRAIPRTPEGKLDNVGVAQALKVVTETTELMKAPEKTERLFRDKKDIQLWAQEELGMTKEAATKFVNEKVHAVKYFDQAGESQVLWVHKGNLTIHGEKEHIKLTTFPFNRVEGVLDLSFVDAIELPENLVITLYFVMINSKITRLPSGLKVFKNFYANDSKLQEIGENSSFGDVDNLLDDQEKRNLIFNVKGCLNLKRIPASCLIGVGLLEFDTDNMELNKSIVAGELEGRITKNN